MVATLVEAAVAEELGELVDQYRTTTTEAHWVGMPLLVVVVLGEERRPYSSRIGLLVEQERTSYQVKN